MQGLLLTNMDYIQELENKLKEAVKPYKGMPLALSGGIDSSLLAALIKPKFVISVKLPGGKKYNETQYSTKVAKYLGLKHIIIEPEEDKFDEYMEKAVRAIGYPIPHFNIFPLYAMYKKLKELGETALILGDGPDETMCGYTRELITAYLYKVFEFEGFENYKPLIMEMLPNPPKIVTRDSIEIDRKSMDDMSDGIAKSFEITNHRPYQDDKELDNFMFDLPDEMKIRNVEFGKYALRKVAAKYLPEEIAWRKKKVGGPVYPVNKVKGWMEEGEFDKTKYLKWQKQILKQTTMSQ